MVISAVQIYIKTAFWNVQMNEFICNSLISWKKISTSQRHLYTSAILLSAHWKWFVTSSFSYLLTSSQMAKLLSRFGCFCREGSFFNAIIWSSRMCWWRFSGNSFSFMTVNCRLSLCLTTKKTPLLSQICKRGKSL